MTVRFKAWNCAVNAVVVLFTLLSACTSKEKQPSSDSIAVHWELVTNFTDAPDVFDAKIELRNNSDRRLNGSNWRLFFNMAPRRILEHSTPQPATLHHINGDWYKLIPAENFSLEPGETIAINYRGVEAVIKETDRPLGPYFVFYDEQGNETDIVEVTEYTWTPFTKADQINRNRQDEEPIPTAAWLYQNNLDMQSVAESEMPAIIPSPVKIETSSDSIAVSDKLQIFYQRDVEREAKYLANILKDITGKTFQLIDKPSGGDQITLQLGNVKVADRSNEAYKLDIGSDGIRITGSDPAGIFYGIQSLRSLIPLKAHREKVSSFNLPVISVEDAPRFGFRGLHLDVSRNFQTKETVLRLLDLLSFYKINRFLFYTTEDEGWRLEIDGLPELTTVGAQRHHTSGMQAAALHPAYGSGPFAKAEGKFGHGYYSRADFIEILQYANERHIKVIPELNFPGHARAAIKAMEARYERLMKEGKEQEANEYRLIDPEDSSQYLSAQAYKDNVVCVARESVYRFYEKVVDEIAKMYQEAGLKLDEFHTGGDEVPEGAWTQSPLAQTLMKSHPEIRDPKNLQTYFFRELVKRLKKRNLKIHGWEEIALLKTDDGKYIPNPEFASQDVVPYIWNNVFDYDLGYRLANAGYDVVLCNVSNFYFDLAYSKDPQEPGLYWAGFVDTRHAFTFAPYDMFKTTNRNSMGQALDLESRKVKGEGSNKVIVESLKASARQHILGVEAQVWSETIKGRDMLEYYILPKLIGFSESAWTAERNFETIASKSDREAVIQKQWNVFANALGKRELPRLSYMNGGYNYRVPPPGAVVDDGQLKANVEYPGLIIRYSTDGSEPTLKSPIYENPISISGEVALKTFDSAGKPSKTVSIVVD
jgi:hexosaminidase